MGLFLACLLVPCSESPEAWGTHSMDQLIQSLPTPSLASTFPLPLLQCLGGAMRTYVCDPEFIVINSVLTDAPVKQEINLSSLVISQGS